MNGEGGVITPSHEQFLDHVAPTLCRPSYRASCGEPILTTSPALCLHHAFVHPAMLAEERNPDDGRSVWPDEMGKPRRAQDEEREGMRTLVLSANEGPTVIHITSMSCYGSLVPSS
jgi:hypothetical protein